MGRASGAGGAKPHAAPQPRSSDRRKTRAPIGRCLCARTAPARPGRARGVRQAGEWRRIAGPDEPAERAGVLMPSRRRFRVVDRAAPTGEPEPPDADAGGWQITVDGRGHARLEPSAPDANPAPAGTRDHLVLVGRVEDAGAGYALEIVVDGWRFELSVEDAARAELFARATRGRDSVARSGPLEIRAIIPGRIAVIAVVPGDRVVAGDSLLVLEAMKMQNELRAPRGGTVGRLLVAPGHTVELGDVLLTLE